MRHRLAVFLATLCITGGASTPVFADDNPVVAILGIEVIDSGQGIDTETTDLARLLTEALRARARLDNSPFTMAANSEKDLLEMKLLSGCADEARACMAAIGRELGANRLMYGKLERRDTGFQVSLKLLNAETKSMERNTVDLIPFADNNPPAINNKWSRVLFRRLAGIPDKGSLTIAANASKATVYVNGELVTSLNNGRARIDGLAEGKHVIVLEADGYRRYQRNVRIRGGRTASVEAKLRPQPRPKPEPTKPAVGPGGRPVTEPLVPTDDEPVEFERPGGTARVLFWTTALTTAGGVAVGTVTGLRVLDLQDEVDTKVNQYITDRMDRGEPSPFSSDENVCISATTVDVNGFVEPDELRAIADACNAGDQQSFISTLSWIFTGVSAAASGYLFYAGYIAPGAEERKEILRGRKQSSTTPKVHVVPTVTPNYFGAGVTIEF